MPDGLIEVHVIADSTGDTAARVARAAAAQFTSRPVRLVRHPRIVTAAGIDTAFARIAAGSDQHDVEVATTRAVFSTVVDEVLRRKLADQCRLMGLPHYDLLSPAIEVLEQASGLQAERIPARPVGVDADYFRRIAAMEYVIRHDDGQHPAGLKDADIVLVGVSRTGKTPLSMYLGYLGYRTANVPLVPGVAAPDTLFTVPTFRVVGLTINPDRLAGIRSRRIRSMTGSAATSSDYAELAAIYDELDHANAIQRRLKCPVIDTTDVALEEAAARIIDVVVARHGARSGTPPGTTLSEGLRT